VPETVFLAMLRAAGFRDAESLGRTGYASSPTTMGMHFRAVKPA
jgi:hypothetical protein